MGIVFILDKINTLPTFYQNYNTSTAMGTFLGGQITGLVVQFAFIGLFAILLAAIGNTFFNRERPKEMQISNWIDVLCLKTSSAALWAQVIFMAICWFGTTKGLGIFSAHIQNMYLPDYLTTSGGTPASINTYLPALGELIDEINGLLLAPFAILGILLVWWKSLRQTNLIILAIFLVLIFQSVITPAKDFYHAGILLAINLPKWAIMFFLIVRYIRFNLLFFAITAWYSLLPTGIRYLEYEPNACQINGYLMILFGLIPIILALLSWQKDRTT
jgi:hypothetical protein